MAKYLETDLFTGAVTPVQYFGDGESGVTLRPDRRTPEQLAAAEAGIQEMIRQIESGEFHQRHVEDMRDREVAGRGGDND